MRFSRRLVVAFAACAGVFTLALATALWRVPSHGPGDGPTLLLAVLALGLAGWLARGLVRGLESANAAVAAAVGRL